MLPLLGLASFSKACALPNNVSPLRPLDSMLIVDRHIRPFCSYIITQTCICLYMMYTVSSLTCESVPFLSVSLLFSPLPDDYSFSTLWGCYVNASSDKLQVCHLNVY